MPRRCMKSTNIYGPKKMSQLTREFKRLMWEDWFKSVMAHKRKYSKIHCRGFKCKADDTTWMADSRGRDTKLICLSGNESKAYRYVTYYELRKYYEIH